MKYLVLIFLLVSHISFAQIISIEPPFPTENSEVVPEVVKPLESSVEEVVSDAEPILEKTTIETPAQIEKETTDSRQGRDESTGTIMIGYQLITSWLPSKKAISYTHILNEKWSLEGEYSWAGVSAPYIGVDLGAIKEKRYTLHARRFVGNSFHFTFGAVYSDFYAKLGDEVLDNFGVEISRGVEASNIGITGGLGNRWQFNSGVTLGIDWIRINIPVAETRTDDKSLKDIASESDQEDVKKVIRTFNRIPTFVLFGLHLGYTF